jgi:hypothetical protein
VPRFLLVELQLKYVLSKLKPKKMKEALDSVPTELPNAYLETLERISRKGPDHLNLALEVLSWLFYAKRPIHMRELREALTVEKGERCHEEEDLPNPDKLIDVCEGLVAYDERSGIVRFAHYTVQEFLREPSTIGRLCRIVDIATSCLTYMMHDVFNRDWTSRDDWLMFKGAFGRKIQR